MGTLKIAVLGILKNSLGLNMTSQFPMSTALVSASPGGSEVPILSKKPEEQGPAVTWQSMEAGEVLSIAVLPAAVRAQGQAPRRESVHKQELSSPTKARGSVGPGWSWESKAGQWPAAACSVSARQILERSPSWASPQELCPVGVHGEGLRQEARELAEEHPSSLLRANSVPLGLEPLTGADAGN